MGIVTAARRAARRTFPARLARRLVVRRRHSYLTKEDVLIASYPKSGNTWLRMMLSMLVCDDISSFDDLSVLAPEIEVLGRDEARFRLQTGGRLVKTHEPWYACYRKAVYVVRDCRDVAVSYYFHQLRDGDFVGSFEVFCQKFMRGKADNYGVWGQHICGWIEAQRRHPTDYLVIRYEDMVSDPEATLTAVASFVGLVVCAEDIRRAVATSDRASMRRRELASGFIEKVARPEIPFVSSSASIRRELLSAELESDLLDAFGAAMKAAGYQFQKNREGQ